MFSYLLSIEEELNIEFESFMIQGKCEIVHFSL